MNNSLRKWFIFMCTILFDIIFCLWKECTETKFPTVDEHLPLLLTLEDGKVKKRNCHRENIFPPARPLLILRKCKKIMNLRIKRDIRVFSDGLTLCPRPLYGKALDWIEALASRKKRYFSKVHSKVFMHKKHMVESSKL